MEETRLIDLYRAIHPKKKEYTFFSRAHGTFSKRDHILGHKLYLNRIWKIEIVSTIFSDHDALNMEVNHTQTRRTKSNTWKLNNSLLNNEWEGNQGRNQKIPRNK